ncbi:MAG: 1,4-beta-N-acetylmuramidase, partial [Clostridia bacterium]|nr:1,4-beta-N-acetylmuramidase [Clostridia bacterium]
KMTVPYKVIDVSAWQGEIDWSAVAESGTDGVIIRLGRYDIEKDQYFEANYRGAKENGLLVGCYYFMGAQSVAEAEAEAEKVAALLDEYRYELELPVFYDVEDDIVENLGNISKLDRQILTDIIKSFCVRMQELGYYSGYYSNVSFALKEYYPEQLYMYPLWIAKWSDNISDSFGNSVWQYSSEGSVPGVDGYCDLNLCFVDFYGFIKENGFNNLK